MDFEKLVGVCSLLKGVEDIYLFGFENVVWKVGGKMFVLYYFEYLEMINLKCDLEWMVELCVNYEGIELGYYMNKKYWNMVVLQGDVNDVLLVEFICYLYELVVVFLFKKLCDEFMD